MRTTVSIALTLTLIVVAPRRPPEARQSASGTAGGAAALVPTNHPRLPADISKLWLAPVKGHGEQGTTALNEFAAAVKLEVEANYTKALPVLSQQSLHQGTLGDYAAYYQGLAELRLGRAADARRTFQALQGHGPLGYLVEAAALREAECNEALSDQAAAVEIYEKLSKTKTTAPDDVLMRLGRAAKAAGDTEKASLAYARVYYEFPLSDLSPLAN